MKEFYVAFVNEKIKEAYEELESGKYEDKKLYEFLTRAIDDLKKNPKCGIRVQNKLIPKDYVQKYGADNIWKYNLPNAWRLLYTIRGNEVIITSIILEWLDHKEYERKFKY